MLLAKKNYIIGFIALIIVSFPLIYLYLDKTTIHTIEAKAEMRIYDEVSEMEDKSDAIAIIKATPKTVNHMTYDEDGLPLWYWTERDVIVKQVIKGDIKVDEAITVLEPYAIGDNRAFGKIEITSDSYTKMVDDEEYIVFLLKDEEGKYLILGGDQGKVKFKGENGKGKYPKIQMKIKNKYGK